MRWHWEEIMGTRRNSILFITLFMMAQPLLPEDHRDRPVKFTTSEGYFILQPGRYSPDI